MTVAQPWVTLAVLAVGAAFGRWLIHALIRRGLAPVRVRETGDLAALGLPVQAVRLPTANGLWLQGWYVPTGGPAPAAAVVLLHGWGGNAETLFPLAHAVWQAGFAVLLPDARCHGLSDDDRFVSMPRFAEDLEHAVAWLRQRPDVDAQRLAAIGHSVGGAAVLLSASRSDAYKAVVSIAAFSHPRTVMTRLLAAKHVPYWPFGWYVLRYVQHVIGYRFDDIAPSRTIASIRSPVLLVHGAEDGTVPVAEAEAIYAARGDAPVQLRIIPGSHDEFGDVTQEVPYLIAFLRANIQGTAHS